MSQVASLEGGLVSGWVGEGEWRRRGDDLLAEV